MPKDYSCVQDPEQDIQLTIAFLTTRVKAPDVDDWKKLIRMLRYLKGTVNLKTMLSASNATTMGLNLKWHIDAAFAVHPNYKSHSGRSLTLGKGSVNKISIKQKLNTKALPNLS